MALSTDEDAAVARITVWQCIGCGKIEAPATCIDVCQDRKTQFVYADAYDDVAAQLALATARLRALEPLVRRLAGTMPRAGEWERSYKAFHQEARKLLEPQGPDTARP